MKLRVMVCLIVLSQSTDLFAQPGSSKKEELYPSRYVEIAYRPDKISVDSLNELTKNHPDDTLKVLWYNRLSELYRDSKSDSALFFAEKAHALAKKLAYVKGICHSLTSLGNYYGTYGTNEFEKSLWHFQELVDFAEKNNREEDREAAISSILNLYFYIGEFAKAMNLSTKALTIAEKNNDIQKIAYYNNLLGFIYLRQGNPEHSRRFYQRYFENASIIADSIMMADANIGLAEVFIFEKKTGEALPLLFQARDYYFRLIDRIGIHFLKAEKIPYTLFILAKAYRDQGDHQQALKYCLRGFEYSKHFLFNLYDLANYYIITGNVYEDLGQMKESIETLHLGLSLSIRIKHAENIRDACQSLSRIYARQGIFDSAFHYERQFNLMKDSITNVRTRREIEQVNAEYNVAKKDQEIQQQQKLHESETAKQNTITASIIAFFLFVFVTGALLYNRYRLKQKSAFQAELNRRQNELFNTVTSIQDKERKRIAQDIHDQVGSVLSAAKLQLSGLEELKGHLTDDQRRKYGSAMSLMDQAAEELRNISHNLMPATLSRLGLVAALRALFDKISECSGLTINFNPHGFENRIEELTELNIYPIVLELINNVVKHACATVATIQLIKHPTYINISVEDNGKGFDVEKAKGNENSLPAFRGPNGQGMGMGSLLSRIEYLKGTLIIDSADGEGTTVMIDIPTRE